MELENWTPAKGWAAAIGRLLLRGIGVALLAITGMALAQYFAGAHYLRGSRIGAIGLLPGVAAGHFLVRGLVNSTGIDGKALILPALLVMAISVALSALGVCAVVQEFSQNVAAVAFVTGIAAVGAIIYDLLTE